MAMLTFSPVSNAVDLVLAWVELVYLGNLGWSGPGGDAQRFAACDAVQSGVLRKVIGHISMTKWTFFAV